MNNDLRKLAATINCFVKTAAVENMPGCISAHYLVAVLFPQLARVCGVEHVAAEMTRHLTKELAIQSGLCCMCHKAPATVPDDGDWYCAKCHAEMLQFAADMDADIPPEADIPQEFIQMVRTKCAESGIEATPDEVRATGDRLVRIARDAAESLGIDLPESDMSVLSITARIMRQKP